ncbi:hypothetical protein M0R45_035479 [Rubus argutus]|uniref:Uncharacterized protein n=1 Tax=Rubus argutus TaxID=59490 RepID=A0AAW1VW62_RUBAR
MLLCRATPVPSRIEPSPAMKPSSEIPDSRDAAVRASPSSSLPVHRIDALSAASILSRRRTALTASLIRCSTSRRDSSPRSLAKKI